MVINHPLKPTLSWLVVFLWMFAIYLLSAQPASLSKYNSKGMVTYVVETAVKMTKAEITEPDKWKLIDSIHSVAREYMHGVVFLVLGLLAQNAVTQSGAKGMKAIAISLAICVVCGITGEIHQLFVPGRAFQISDLVMDSIGSIIGIAAMWFLYNRVQIKPKI